MPGRAFYVVAYDIPDNRRRNRLFKTMRGFGRHTQFSVFECHLDRLRLEKLIGKITALIDPVEDNVKVYPLCRDCLAGTVTLGIAPPTAFTDSIVV